jgi:hypothetical protein
MVVSVFVAAVGADDDVGENTATGLFAVVVFAEMTLAL